MLRFAPILLILASCRTAHLYPETLSDEARQVLDLIGEFDVVDTSKLPFVQISRGGYESKYGTVLSRTSFGFLERTSGSTIHLRLVHLMREAVTPRPEGSSFEKGPACEEVSFAEVVRVRLQSQDEDRFPFGSVDEEFIFHERVADAILARDCYRRGLKEEGDALIGRAMKEDFDWLLRRLAQGLNHLLILRFRDPQLSRRDL